MIAFLFLLIGAEAASLGLPQYFVKEPSDTVGTTGEKIRFRCEVQNRQGSCQWTKNGFGLGTDEELSGFPRFSLDMSEGGCDLVIEPVQLQDEGEYQCQAGAVPGVKAIKSNKAQLTVNQEPGRPHIKQMLAGDVMEVMEDQLVELECVSQGGKPSADITWRHGDGSRLEAEVVDIISTMEDRKVFESKSIIKFVPERNEEVYCEAASDVFKVPIKSPEIKIRLKNSPRADLKFSKDIVEVGENVDVECEVEGSEKVLQYQWRINGKELSGEKSGVLSLEKVQAENDKMLVSCRVKMESGKWLDAEGRLKVRTQLTVSLHPSTVTVSAGEEFSLRCLTEGAERVDIVWSRGEDNRLAGVGARLDLVGGEDTAGEYVCTAIADKAPVRSNPGRVTLRRTEEVRVKKEMVYGIIGSSAELSCQVENYHNGTTLGWRMGDRIILSDGVKYTIINQQNSDTLNTNLIIKDTDETDFSSYTCFVDTLDGLQERKVELRNGNNSNFILSVIANVTGGVIILSILLFLFWRRRLRIKSVMNMENQKEIYKSEDKSTMEKLLLTNDNFRIEFNCDDLINETPKHDVKKSKRLGRFYSAPNGSFASDNTVLSFVHDD